MNHREYQYLEPEVWIAEVLHLLSLEEFTELLRSGNSFALLRVVATGRYLQLKIQELYEAMRPSSWPNKVWD